MNDQYINIYNNLVKLTRNKALYKNFSTQDTFSDRLIFFLFHFGFFLKVFKKNTEKKILQDIYDYNFKQLELSIREIGYGDVSINKKMKTYLNTFYSILDKIDNWEMLSSVNKGAIISSFLNINADTSNLTNYFDKYLLSLSNNTLNSFTKGVIKLKF
jgi:cytochrome b pre-mRNA-processing protein 3